MNGNAETVGQGQYSGQKLFTLLGNLRQDLTDLVKGELNLLKSEISATVSNMGKDGILVVAGGFIAYTGAIFVLIGLAALIAFALHKAGLSVMMATWISFLVFGLAIAGTGYALLKSGLSKFAKVKIAPNETIATVKEFARPGNMKAAGIVASADLKDEKSEKTHKARVAAEKKIEKVQSELAEVQARMKPKYMWAATCTAAKRRPAAAAGIGAAVIALGYLMAKRRSHHRNGKVLSEDYELVLD